MIPKPDFTSVVKYAWFGLASLLLGPFALWFILSAKKNRRNLEPRPFFSLFILTASFLFFAAILFAVPVHWGILVGLYIAASLASMWAMCQKKRSDYFRILSEQHQSTSSSSYGVLLLSISLAILPWVYIISLLHNIGELEGFSIRLPSDVYTQGLIWMLFAAPAVAAATWMAWKVNFQATLRTLIFFYGAAVVILLWIMVWEKFDQSLLNEIYGAGREPLYFNYLGEAHYRMLVKAIFYGGAFILGIAYLMRSARTSVFLKRAFFLGVPSLLLYANMLFVIGDWNYYLAGIRQKALLNRQYALFRITARASLARTPAAFRNPSLLDDWSEMEYQEGNRDRSISLMHRLIKQCGTKPYFARLRKRTNRSLAALEKTGRALGKADSANSSLNKVGVLLGLPVIQPADYLDQEWYALLSAVAYLKPAWTDLDLKKKLLELSNTVRLNLPRLDNVPDLIPALRLLEIPVSTCFLTKDRIKNALSAGHVPFLSLYGHWVPISGYDPGRDGFYYYVYQAPGGWDWFRNENTDLFSPHAESAFGGSDSTERQSGSRLIQRTHLQKFISADELVNHLMDIGGVGMVLGDSAIGDSSERRAAFLVEQGDVYYQEHENYAEAANSYEQAGKLCANDQIYSRMLYLKRRYWEYVADPADYQNLFRDYPPAWMRTLGPEKKIEQEIVAKVLEGKLGSYLMMNWYVAPILDTTTLSGSNKDTALILFTHLHTMEPEEPLYTDSLATLLIRRGNLQAGERLFTELAGLYPFGSESAEYRLAWTKLKLGKVKEIPQLLDRCKGYSGEARYLTLQAAVAMEKEKYRTAYSALSRSLKLDKSILESHDLMKAYYRHKGDMAAERVEDHWRQRSI